MVRYLALVVLVRGERHQMLLEQNHGVASRLSLTARAALDLDLFADVLRQEGLDDRVSLSGRTR